MLKRARFAAAVMSLALIAGACSDDEEVTTSTEAATETVAAETAAPAETTAETAAAAETAVAETAAAETAAAETTAVAADDPVAAAKAKVAQFLVPPADIPLTEKLTSKPPKKKVYWLVGEAPSTKPITVGIQGGADVLGWDLEIVDIKAFEPASYFQQAIDGGADYIAISGTPYALFEEQAKAADAKGIKIGIAYGTEDPNTPEFPALLTQVGDEGFVQNSGALIGNWIIADSGAKANVLVVSLPDYPILVAETDVVKATIKDGCAACTIEEYDFTLDDLIQGKVGAGVASRLQANPDLNYVFFSFGDAPAGVTDALSEAGLLEGRKLVGQDGAASIGIAEIANGRHAAWTTNPKPYAGWLIMDAFARHSIGQENPQERSNAVLPTFIIDTPELAKEIQAFGDAGWPGPTNMADQFKALWGL